MAQPPPPARKPGGDDAEPSMDDILASIRRILDEDGAAKPAGKDVLMLDPSMMVEDGKPGDPTAPPATPVPAPESQSPMTAPNDDLAPAAPPRMAEAPAAPAPSLGSPSLVAPEAAAAAANSVGTLMRTLAAERSAQVGRGSGVTLEDLVREEMRPLLKAWLDTHLPPIVERAVRAEIERVVGRQVG